MEATTEGNPVMQDIDESCGKGNHFPVPLNGNPMSNEVRCSDCGRRMTVDDIDYDGKPIWVDADNPNES